VALVAPVVPDLERDAPPGLEEPTLVYLTCYQVLRAAGDGRAHGVLAAGHAFLQKRAAQFVDEGRRSRFLGALAAHRELLDEWRARGGRGAANRRWSPPAVTHRGVRVTPQLAAEPGEIHLRGR
jgi:hypothetical protein